LLTLDEQIDSMRRLNELAHSFLSDGKKSAAQRYLKLALEHLSCMRPSGHTNSRHVSSISDFRTVIPKD
jgi:hypothetical protein